MQAGWLNLIYPWYLRLYNFCLPRGRHSEAAHEKRLLCAQKCTRGGVGHVGVGWGGVGHAGGWGGVMQGWGWVCHVGVGWGGVGHAGGWGVSCRGGGGVCHVGVGWGGGVMQGGVGCVMQGWGGSCRGVVGWVMYRWGGVDHVGVGGWVIHVEEFTLNFLWVTLTQKIITCRVLKNSQMDIRGCVWVGESFSSHDKWQIILLSDFFPNSHSTFYEWL